MVDSKQIVAQSVYLAQLQACKGKCACNVCKLLRKSADAMTEEVLSDNPGTQVITPDLIQMFKDQGYQVQAPEDRG